MPEILPWIEMDAQVIPVLNKPVQVLKKPPEGRTDGEKKQEKPRAINHHTSPFSSESESIYNENEGEPEWSKGVELEL